MSEGGAVGKEVSTNRSAIGTVKLTSIVGWILFFVLIYIALYAAVSYLSYYSETTDSRTLGAVRDELRTVGSAGWEFVKPLLQLAVVLSIVSWGVERFGLKIGEFDIVTDQRVKGLLAVLVVVGFIVSVLGSLQFTSDLKDVALVIVGFYFGSNAPKLLGSASQT